MKKIILFAVLIFSSITLYAGELREIIVFTNPGCSRCAYIVGTLKKNNIEFKEYSASDRNSPVNMWQALQASGKFKGGSIMMPVVLYNNQTLFNIEDLKATADSLIAYANNGSESGDIIQDEKKQEEKKPEPDNNISGFFAKNKKFSYSAENRNPVWSGTGTATVTELYENTVKVSIDRKVEEILLGSKWKKKDKVVLELTRSGDVYTSTGDDGYTGKADVSDRVLKLSGKSGFVILEVLP